MPEHEIELTVNDTANTVSVEGRTLLIHALRDQLGATGPKIGCERGKCGACTVRLDGEVVKSCMILAVQADGKSIETIGGVGGDALDPVQEAFRAEHGLQCGYCTPGMVLATHALLESNEDPTRPEIREALKGNVCRCTGYHNIVNAIERASKQLAAQEGAE